MRSIFNLFLFITGATVFLNSCDKAESLPLFANGVSPVLTASANTVAPLPADSNNVALTLSWSNPKYATDSNSVKYTIEIDTTGRNFSNPYTRIVTGTSGTQFTAKELNNILLGYGYAFGVPVDMDVRVTSSYSNNNERLASNILKIKMTPYKVPPKVALPTSNKLFLVGSASQGGWNNPVPVPNQEFARLDETTWGGVFKINGGMEYLLLPVNGDWSHKYSVSDNSIAGLNQGGNFGYDLAQNIPGPSSGGLYKIIVDFQSGKFIVSPFTGVLPDSLYIVGDATAGGWNNPVPVPSQKLTRINSAVYEISISLTGGKQYLLLPVNGDWSHKFSVADNSLAGLAAGGSFGYDLPQNFPGPATSGVYKITVNFVTGKFTVTP